MNAIDVIAAAFRQQGTAVDPDIGSIDTTTYRAPFTPVSFVALAGRQRRDLFDTARRTSIHTWHEQLGAVFEDVGQWKRPRSLTSLRTVRQPSTWWTLSWGIHYFLTSKGSAEMVDTIESTDGMREFMSAEGKSWR